MEQRRDGASFEYLHSQITFNVDLNFDYFPLAGERIQLHNISGCQSLSKRGFGHVIRSALPSLQRGPHGGADFGL
jgi:hypothetical protein